MLARREANRSKCYVKVRADFDFDGKIRPLLFREENGPTCRIDHILGQHRIIKQKEPSCQHIAFGRTVCA